MTKAVQAAKGNLVEKQKRSQIKFFGLKMRFSTFLTSF